MTVADSNVAYGIDEEIVLITVPGFDVYSLLGFDQDDGGDSADNCYNESGQKNKFPHRLTIPLNNSLLHLPLSLRGRTFYFYEVELASEIFAGVSEDEE